MTHISSWSFIYEHREGLTPFSLQISDHNLLLSDVKLTQIIKQLQSRDIPQEDKELLCYFSFVLKGIWFKRREISHPLGLWSPPRGRGPVLGVQAEQQCGCCALGQLQEQLDRGSPPSVVPHPPWSGARKAEG